MRTICISNIEGIGKVKEILESFSRVTYLPGIPKSMLKEEISWFDAIFVNPNNLGYVLNEDLLKGSSIKVICTASTGTDHIDKDYCKNNNIEILCLKEERRLINKISSTAEHAFGLMLALLRNIPKSFKSATEYKWDCTSYVGRQVQGMKIGIVGYGRLGNYFHKYCEAMGAKICIHDPFVTHPENVSIEQMFEECDVISLHLHLNKNTEGMINQSLFSRSNGLYLINTSRGKIVNEDDVICALERGNLAGYATDVLADELGDLTKSEILKNVGYYNIIVTPHIGGATKEAQEMAYSHAAKMLKSYAEKNNGKS